MDDRIQSVIIGTTKSLIEYIPIIGSVLTNSYDEFSSIQEQRKINRLEELCIGLQQDIDSLKSRINKEYVNNTEFSDVFEEVV